MSKYAIVMWLTCGRAPLVVIASILTVINAFRPNLYYVGAAVVVMAVAALTDLFDGKYARKWNVSSRLGALADPLMDKVFYAVTLPVATFVAMYNEDVTHALVLVSLDVISMIRDQWVTFLRSVGSEYGADVRANWSGKLRTIIGFPVIVVIHLQLGLQTIQMQEIETLYNLPLPLMYALEGILIAITLISAWSYTLRYMPYLKQAAQHGGK